MVASPGGIVHTSKNFACMWPPFDERGRPRIMPLVLFGGAAALMLFFAAVQLVYGGPYASLWLAIAGFFVFGLVMMLLTLIMVWRQCSNIR